jgi:hypothetical protein
MDTDVHAEILVSASCRDLQAGSLRSPDGELAQLPSVTFLQADRVPVKKCLLARVMWLVRFRLGRFFSWLSLNVQPFGVEDAGLVNALIRVRTKEIALRL